MAAANSQTLLNIIKPSLVAISYGNGNAYGHPHQELKKELVV